MGKNAKIKKDNRKLRQLLDEKGVKVDKEEIRLSARYLRKQKINAVEAAKAMNKSELKQAFGV